MSARICSRGCLLKLVNLVFFLFLGFLPAETRAAHDSEDVVDTVTPERLKYYIDNNETLVIIDLRPLKDYKEKRLPGARSIPINELDKNLTKYSRARAG